MLAAATQLLHWEAANAAAVGLNAVLFNVPHAGLLLNPGWQRHRRHAVRAVSAHASDQPWRVLLRLNGGFVFLAHACFPSFINHAPNPSLKRDRLTAAP